MADILYTLEYTETGGFKRPVQTVLSLEAKGDRVAFVITKKTAAEMKKEGKQVALKRHSKDPFDDKMKEIYVVPVETKGPFEFFSVKQQQKLMTGHLICGELDDKTGKFARFTKRSNATPPIPLLLKPKKKTTKPGAVKKTPSGPSLPIPN